MCFVFADSRKSSEVRLEDIKNVRPRMSRLSEDFDGEEAALKEQDNGFVNILKEEKTLRSSITSDRIGNPNTFDKRRHNFRQRRNRSFEKGDASKRLNGCIAEEGESPAEGRTSDKKDINGDNICSTLEAFDQMIMEIDSDSSDSKEEDKDCILMSNICLTETENVAIMYPTLSKDRRTTSIPPEVEMMTNRKSSTASTDSAQSDEDRDVKRSESFASFGSSIKIVQQRQVIQTFRLMQQIFTYMIHYITIYTPLYRQ